MFDIPSDARMQYLSPAERSIIQTYISEFPEEGLEYADPIRLIYIMAEQINLLEKELGIYNG